MPMPLEVDIAGSDVAWEIYARNQLTDVFSLAQPPSGAEI